MTRPPPLTSNPPPPGIVRTSITNLVPNVGFVTIRPSVKAHVRQVGRYFAQNGTRFYIAGVGGPEGFPFLTAARKQKIVDDLVRNGVNGIYFHTMRSHGGDGSPSEHLFLEPVNATIVDRNISAVKLNELASYLDQFDQAGVLMWLNIFDDHAKPYGCINDANAQRYADYAISIATAFKSYKHLIWVTQEEYNWLPDKNGCTADENVRLQILLAKSIRSVDTDHAIATHHMNGQAFAFANAPNITVYAQQTWTKNDNDMHEVSGLLGWNSKVAYVMSEAYSYHQTLIKASNDKAIRTSMWATAFSGGSVFVHGAYESLPDPSETLLASFGRLQRFMNSLPFRLTTPLFGTALQSRRLAGTKFILLNDTRGIYILYGLMPGSTRALGVTSALSGRYLVRFFNPETSTPADLVGGWIVNHPGGSLSLPVPGTGDEAALYLKRLQ